MNYELVLSPEDVRRPSSVSPVNGPVEDPNFILLRHIKSFRIETLFLMHLKGYFLTNVDKYVRLMLSSQDGSFCHVIP